MRSEDETLAGAPRCSLMLTFLSLSTREIALGDVLPAERGRARSPSASRAPCWAPPTARGPCSPACWMREAGVEATGSAALRSRLAGAPEGGPGGRARGADPRSCPIRSSRSCSRRSRSTSSGLRAAPCGEAGGGPVSLERPECLGARRPHGRHGGGGGQGAHRGRGAAETLRSNLLPTERVAREAWEGPRAQSRERTTNGPEEGGSWTWGAEGGHSVLVSCGQPGLGGLMPSGWPRALLAGPAWAPLCTDRPLLLQVARGAGQVLGGPGGSHQASLGWARA